MLFHSHPTGPRKALALAPGAGLAAAAAAAASSLFIFWKSAAQSGRPRLARSNVSLIFGARSATALALLAAGTERNGAARARTCRWRSVSAPAHDVAAPAGCDE